MGRQRLPGGIVGAERGAACASRGVGGAAGRAIADGAFLLVM
jgi:hypothetical protein